MVAVLADDGSEALDVALGVGDTRDGRHLGHEAVGDAVPLLGTELGLDHVRRPDEGVVLRNTSENRLSKVRWMVSEKM